MIASVENAVNPLGPDMAKGSDFEDAYALIIGISNYKDPKIPKLNYARADAEGIFKLLTDPKRMGLKQYKIKVLLDDDATLFNIINTISGWLFKNADEKSVVFIYFAGHGGVEEDRLGIEKDKLAKYMLPFDSNFDNFYASALSNRGFNELLSIIKSKKVIIFLDFCYAGGVSERKARDVKITEDPYKKLAEGEGRLAIAASQPDQRSFEDKDLGHGIFTHHLMEALSGAADSDNDGYVTAMEMYKYLSENVPKTARRLAGGIQEPILRGDLKTDFVVAVNREKLEEIEHENIKKNNLKRLSDWYYEGELSAAQYELIRRLIKSSPEDLSKDEKKVLKMLNDLLSGEISISTFKDEVESIQKIKEPSAVVKPQVMEIIKEKEIRREDEEKKKQIIELSSSAQRLFEERDYEGAIIQWQEVLKSDFENSEAIEGIEKSKRILNEINTLNVSAQRLYEDGRYNQAIDKWNEVLNIDPKSQIALQGIEKAKNKIKSMKVRKYCPSCGHPNVRELKYCTECGAKLFVS